MAATARSKTLPPLKVRYPKRMKQRKTYTVRVTWSGRPPQLGEDAPDIKVRLVMGGAQVVPSERSMNPNKPGNPALFYITPLAKGWLRGERLEVIAEGEKIQEIALPAKVVSQRKTWIFLLLAILLPVLILNFVQKFRVAEQVNDPWTKHIEKPTPAGWVMKKSPKSFEEVWRIGRVTYNLAWRAVESDEILVSSTTKTEKFNVPKVIGVGVGGGGQIPKKNVNGNDANEPKTMVSTFQEDNRIKLYLPFYAFATFFLLALISLWWNKQRWKQRLGKPIRLAIADD